MEHFGRCLIVLPMIVPSMLDETRMIVNRLGTQGEKETPRPPYLHIGTKVNKPTYALVTCKTGLEGRTMVRARQNKPLFIFVGL